VYLPAEQRQRLRILARTPGVPTHVISIRGDLSEELKARVKSALLKLSQEQGELLEDVYGTARFVEVDEAAHVAASVEALEYLGIDPGTIVNR
jgi:ABC-type phosphate/phosphonate transport system substrate-binding protein